MTQAVTKSKAREQFSSLLDDVCFRGNDAVIKRKGKPGAKLSDVIPQASAQQVLKKWSQKMGYGKEKSEIFGLWKDTDESTIEIADRLRKEAWGR